MSASDRVLDWMMWALSWLAFLAVWVLLMLRYGWLGVAFGWVPATIAAAWLPWIALLLLPFVPMALLFWWGYDRN